jgi:hypothetical protein
MITSGGQERRLTTEALRQVKPKHTVVKRERSIQIRNFQMNMADPDGRVKRARLRM